MLISKFSLFIGLRYFFAKKNEKFISVISFTSLIGIAIGVAALIVVMAVMNGFHIELTSNIVGLNGEISIISRNNVINNFEEIDKKLSDLKFVKKIVPVISGQAFVLGKNSNSGVMIKGLNIDTITELKTKLVDNVIAGNFDDYTKQNSIALGSQLAYNLGVAVGDKVKIIAPNTISTIFGSLPRAQNFKIIAIFNSGLYEYDAATVLMPIKEAQSFFSLEKSINLIEILTQKTYLVQEHTKIIQKILGNSFLVNNWESQNIQFFNALKIERMVMFTILSLIIIVAAFNIISSLFMLVKDRMVDIAILRIMGASRQQIISIFIINGMIIGKIGTLLGVIFGVLISKNIDNIRLFLEKFSHLKIFDPAIYFLYHLPSEITIRSVVTVASFSIFLSLLASIYPSYKASSLNPVEVIRYE